MSLAGLALAILAARAGGNSSGEAASAAIAATQALTIQNQINFTRENEYEADRIGFQRLDAAGFDVTAMATFMERLQRSIRFVEGNAPTYLRTHPITYERIAEAQARAQGQPYRQVRRRSTSTWCARCCEATRASRRKRSPFSTTRSPSTSTTTRSPRTTVSSRRCCARRITSARRRSSAALEKIAPPHPMIDAMAGHVMLDTGDVQAAIKRFETARQSLSEQDAARLRLSGGAAAGRTQRRRGAIRRAPARATSRRRAVAASRRARLCGAEHADARASPPGRVLRMAGQSEGRDRAVRDRVEGRRTATSTRRRSSTRG